MTTKNLLAQLKHGSTRALEQIIHTYSAYVVTIIRNRSRNMLTEQDIEEIASDVFFSLWENRNNIRTAQLKQWLGSVARNKTIDYLRKQNLTLPLDDTTISVPDTMWQKLATQERRELVESAIQSLSPEDQIIFRRYYSMCQTTVDISKVMGISTATIRTRLYRGREKLRQNLKERGFADETDI